MIHLKYAPGSMASAIGPRIEAWIEELRAPFTSRDAARAVASVWTGEDRQLLSSVRGIITRLDEAGAIVCIGYSHDTATPCRTLREYAPVSIVTSEQRSAAAVRAPLPTGHAMPDGTRVHYARFGQIRFTSDGRYILSAEVADGDAWRPAAVLKHDPRSNGAAWNICEHACIKSVLSILGTRDARRRGIIRIEAVDDLHKLDVRAPYVHSQKHASRRRRH